MGTAPGEADLRRRLARAARRERLRLGLTQEEVAERAGVAPRQLQRVEAGAVNAGLSTIAGLCRAFRVDIQVLFENPPTGEDSVKPSTGQTRGRGRQAAGRPRR